MVRELGWEGARVRCAPITKPKVTKPRHTYVQGDRCPSLMEPHMFIIITVIQPEASHPSDSVDSLHTGPANTEAQWGWPGFNMHVNTLINT